jgi:Ni/Fe-hydrogenase subunit HybB-like protein
LRPTVEADAAPAPARRLKTRSLPNPGFRFFVRFFDFQIAKSIARSRYCVASKTVPARLGFARMPLIIALLAILAGAVFVGHYGWISAGNVTMPAWGWLMMGLGIIVTLVVGCGLMALVFYSHRAGFDDAPEQESDSNLE